MFWASVEAGILFPSVKAFLTILICSSIYGEIIKNVTLISFSFKISKIKGVFLLGPSSNFK